MNVDPSPPGATCDDGSGQGMETDEMEGSTVDYRGALDMSSILCSLPPPVPFDNQINNNLVAQPGPSGLQRSIQRSTDEGKVSPASPRTPKANNPAKQLQCPPAPYM